MAGLFTHMVIAREIIKVLPEETIKDQGLFYLGNLAPDAIHVREGYIRAFKKHTHLRDDISDPEFAQEDNLELFHKRVADFIIQNRERKDGLLDLYRGYVVHLLADELFNCTIRKEFCVIMEEQGIGQMNTTFFERIITDMNRNDFLLADRYEGRDEIRYQLEQAPIHPITDYLSEHEMRVSRDWIINRHFVEKTEVVLPVYISYERTMAYIHMAVDNIITRLSEGGSLPAMF